MQSNEFKEAPEKTARRQAEQSSPFRGLWVTGLAVALAAFFASTLPQVFFVAVFGELLFFGALGTMIVAALRQAPVWPQRLTAWDQAALLALLSGVVGLFVDVESVAAALQEQAAAAN